LNSRISICSGVIDDAVGDFQPRSSFNCRTYLSMVDLLTFIAEAVSATV